ncbi:DNA adenine methylase [Kingella sp. SNUBH-2017]|uniref:DNA adenine methylase n=1 Tax=Kingella sp. SNUBH-2017 TaxID=2994077 RepID=UPI002363D1FC|nr:DNA adenine methylase [Kingella sp. SNUBH-2017]MDD2183676.1 DNA adenine methylase [Kingella sp. SNUBH-2017]
MLQTDRQTDRQTDAKPAPIIRWIGGKRRLAKHLLPLFPDHSCYVEPFCGGAALFFLRSERAKVEVLNDINGNITNLYRVVQHHFDEFVRQFDHILTARETFERLQAVPPECLTDIQRAARFYYLQNNAFGGRVREQNFGTTTTSAVWRADRIAQRLAAARRRLSGVIIENGAWHKCFERYDRPHTFFYLDPPYWQTEGYGYDFAWEQYQKLAEMMSRSQGKAMLSINDHPDIRALFKDFRLHELQISYNLSRDKTPKASGELVICNW